MSAPSETVQSDVVHDDAQAFGQHFKQGSWRLGLLVARNVHMADDERGRSDLEAPKVGKVTANQFADRAGVTARTVQLFYRAWQLAAKDGRCTPARELSPGDEDPNINFEADYEEERDEWLEYYRKAKRSSKATPKKKTSTDAKNPRNNSRTPEARLSIAVKSIEGIDVASASDKPELRQRLEENRQRINHLIDQHLEAIDAEVPKVLPSEEDAA